MTNKPNLRFLGVCRMACNRIPRLRLFCLVPSGRVLRLFLLGRFRSGLFCSGRSRRFAVSRLSGKRCNIGRIYRTCWGRSDILHLSCKLRFPRGFDAQPSAFGAYPYPVNLSEYHVGKVATAIRAFIGCFLCDYRKAHLGTPSTVKRCKKNDQQTQSSISVMV